MVDELKWCNDKSVNVFIYFVNFGRTLINSCCYFRFFCQQKQILIQLSHLMIYLSKMDYALVQVGSIVVFVKSYFYFFLL